MNDAAQATPDSQADNQNSPSAQAVLLSTKAWTAYVSLVVRGVLLSSLSVWVLVIKPEIWVYLVPALVLAAALIAYRVLYLRSIKLYHDVNGVWLYSGVLPWRRGVSGVKWRDLDEALFVNGFWSWVSGAYTVQLRHRYTKAIEIQSDNMSRGKDAVQTINQQHQQYIRQTGRE